MKENLIRCVDLIGKSLHPAHLKTDKLTLHRRAELLGHMQAYMAAETAGKLKNEIRGLAMDACTTLVTLEPKLTESALFALVETSSECVFQLPEVGEGDEAAVKLMDMTPTDVAELADPRHRPEGYHRGLPDDALQAPAQVGCSRRSRTTASG